ncbi:MAG TPA: PepSY domain-containing protein [Phycisphaerae bacterium]|nr:PepSY domain-containing protein [Phycisphaerae bacterium]
MHRNCRRILQARLAVALVLSSLASGHLACRSASEPVVRLPAQMPPARQADANRPGIIVDIDETISITDYPTLVFGIGHDDSKPYENAREVLASLSEQFDLVYLTSRPQWLAGETHEWLAKQQFPPGKVLTTARMVDVYWPGSFKKRAIGALRHTSPTLLIGIGDRHTDIEAYVANNMLALVVHPRRGVKYHPDAIILQDWPAVQAFFEEHKQTLCDPDALRAHFGVGGPPLDPATVRTEPEMDLSLLVKVPLLGPTLLVENVAKLGLAHEQREALQALERLAVPFEDVLREVTARFGEENLLELRLAIEGGELVFIVEHVRDGEVFEDELDSRFERVEPPERLIFLRDDPLTARVRARLTFSEALARALEAMEGLPCEIELEMDDGRPTYEIAMWTLGRFIEVEVDAETGEVIEIEDETALR